MIKQHIMEYYFQNKCSEPTVKLKEVKRYYFLHSMIDISSHNERAFYNACYGGKFKSCKMVTIYKT